MDLYCRVRQSVSAGASCMHRLHDGRQNRWAREQASTLNGRYGQLCFSDDTLHQQGSADDTPALISHHFGMC